MVCLFNVCIQLCCVLVICCSLFSLVVLPFDVSCGFLVI